MRECGANLVIANAHDYQYATYKGNKGTGCTNGALLDRVELEYKIRGPIQKELFEPWLEDRLRCFIASRSLARFLRLLLDLQLAGIKRVHVLAFYRAPRAAERGRRHVARGLDGNQQAAQKGRMFIREWFGGKSERSD